MNNTNAKVITVSFALAGFLVGFTVHLLLKVFAGAFGAVARLNEIDLVKHGGPVAIGFIVFLALQFNKDTVSYGESIVAEVKKVVWPSRKDTVAMTIACLLMVAVSSVIIASFDFISGIVLNQLVR